MTRQFLPRIALFVALLLSSPGFAAFEVTDAPSDTYSKADLLARLEKGELDKVREGIIDEYTGPLSATEEVRALRKAIPSIRKKAIEHNRSLLGLPKDFEFACFVTIADRTEGSKSGNNMETTSVEHGGRSYSLVTIFPDSLVIGRVVPAMTLTHELNHAVLREWLGDTYRSTPTWWREGVAVHSAGQTERRLRVLLAGKLSNSLRSLAQAANIVPSLINGIKDKHDFDDYAEDVLLIEWALSQNPKALVEMVAAIKEGKDVEGAYAASLGMTWAEALATGFDYARRRMYALEGGNHIKVVKAVQSLLERSAEVSKGVEGAKEGLLAHIKDADKALDYKADQSIEKSNYAHLVWAYYRLRGLALAGEEANAIKGLIAEVNDDDGQIRATTLTTAAVRRIVDTAIAAKDWETAKEWVTRLEYGYAYGSTTAAWVKAKREAIAQGKAGTSDENAADDEPNEQPNEDDQQDGKD